MTSPRPHDPGSRGSAFDIVGRSVALLETVATEPRPQSLSDLSRRLAVPKTTVHRMLDVLVRQDLLERRRDGYTLGSTMLGLSHLVVERAPKDIVELLEPFAGDLFERTGDYVMVGVPDGDFVAIVHSIRSHRHATLPAMPERIPAQRSAIGKLWLAEHPDEAIRELDSGSAPPTSDLGHILGELHRIRQTGVATAVEQIDTGVVDIAMPIIGATGMLAGIARRCAAGQTLPLSSALAHHQIALAASAAARRFERHAPLSSR